MPRELTPLEHEKIRRQIVLVPVYAWLVYGWIGLFVTLPFGLRGLDPRLVRDFAHFYVQGVIANERDTHALYDIDAQPAILKRVVPGGPEVRYPPVHGPQMSLFFSPLARLPYPTALILWQLLTVLTFATCGYAVWRVCPRLRGRPWPVFWLLLAAPALRFELGFAQTAAIGLVCLTAAFFALRANRFFLAGLAIGSLVYKPQLGIAAAFIFVFAGEWRIVFGAVVAAVAQLAVGALYWGPGMLAQYVGALRRLPDVTASMEPFKFDMHSWRTFFELLQLPPAVALAAYVVAASATLIVALACWRSRGPLALRYSAFVLATVLVDPHMWVYDLVLLMPALLVLWDWALDQPERKVGDVLPARRFARLRQLSFPLAFLGLLYFCYFSPLFGALADLIRVQLSVLAFFSLVLVIAAVLWVERGGDPFVPDIGAGRS